MNLLLFMQKIDQIDSLKEGHILAVDARRHIT